MKIQQQELFHGAALMQVVEDPRFKALNTLLASGPRGAARSADGGKSWNPVNVPEGAFLVEASTSNPELLYAADHQGSVAQVWVSRDGGRAWARP